LRCSRLENLESDLCFVPLADNCCRYLEFAILRLGALPLFPALPDNMVRVCAKKDESRIKPCCASAANIYAISSNPGQGTPCLPVRVRLDALPEAREFDHGLGCSTEGATDMPRILMTSFTLAAGIMVLTPQANAQSPDPALLAPTAAQPGLAASQQNTALRPTYTSPRSGGTPANMKSRFGQYLSHPRVHGL
jgi:hypothetical protein